MHEGTDSPTFASTIKQCRPVERTSYLQPDHKRKIFPGFHQRSSSQLSFPRSESNSKIFSMEQGPRNSVFLMSRNTQDQDHPEKNTLYETGSFRNQVNDEKTTNRKSNKTEPPMMNPLKFHSPPSNPTPLNFISPTSKGFEVKQYYDRETRKNDQNRELVVMNRVSTASRTHRDSNSPKVSPHNCKSGNGWLAEMERQRIELQKAREDEKRKQKLREGDRYDQLILEQQNKIGIDSKLYKRDYSPGTRETLADNPYPSRITFKNIQKEMFDRNDLRNLLECPTRRKHEHFTEQKDTLSFDQIDRAPVRDFKLPDSGSKNINPFHFAQTTVQKVKNDLSIATELAQRLLSNRAEKNAEEIQKTQPDRTYQNFLDGKKTELEHKERISHIPDRESDEFKFFQHKRDRKLNYPPGENKHLLLTPVENSKNFEDKEMRYSFQSPTNNAKKFFETDNKANSSAFQKMVSPQTDARTKSNPRSYGFEKSRNLDINRNSAFRVEDAQREFSYRYSRQCDGSNGRMTNTNLRDRPSSNVAVNSNFRYSLYTPESRSTRNSQKPIFLQDNRNTLSPEKTERAEKETRQSPRLTISRSRPTHSKNKSVDFSASTLLNNQKPYNESYQSDWEAKLARKSSANYHFLINNDIGDDQNYCHKERYTTKMQNNEIPSTRTSTQLERPSENLLKIAGILKNFRS